MSYVPPVIRIDGRAIVDQDGFHRVFEHAFGFPEFYGRNMDAWIDCMSSLDDPDSGMSTICVQSGYCLTLQIDDAASVITVAPDVWKNLTECAGFVNWRRLEQGKPAVLSLSYYA